MLYICTLDFKMGFKLVDILGSEIETPCEFHCPVSERNETSESEQIGISASASQAEHKRR